VGLPSTQNRVSIFRSLLVSRSNEHHVHTASRWAARGLDSAA
jgi:hypothetical protein